ncbi:MAG: nickel pincer cofactor biosynthesis protein LarC [Actinomycetota bacterium]
MTDASTRSLWLDPGFGASGDMMLGTLMGLSSDPAATARAVATDLAPLGVDGWTISVERCQRAGIGATRAVVATSPEPHHHRTWSSIDAMIAAAPLADEVRAGARRSFRALGEAEAEIHHVTIDEVHFHEVGAVDAIVDIVGAWAARHRLGVDRVIAGPIGLGQGRVNAAHGELPLPAPATLSLLHGAPVRGLDTAGETVTPTGAALLATMVDEWGPIPAGTITASARGAGGRDPSTHPNVVTGIIVDAPTPTAPATSAVVLATNVDDVTPEVIGRTIDRCLAEGADDAWATPMVMKKSRPAHEIKVLVAPERAEHLRAVLLAETGSLGVRTESVTKHALERHTVEVTVRGEPIRMKVGPHGAKPEHDELRALSDRIGVPVRTLAAEAMSQFLIQK